MVLYIDIDPVLIFEIVTADMPIGSDAHYVLGQMLELLDQDESRQPFDALRISSERDIGQWRARTCPEIRQWQR